MSQTTASQQKAIEHFRGPMIVSASAGSGKTFVLKERVCNLIETHNVDPEKILAITFTKKAAEEMRTRIKNSLDALGLTTYPKIGTFHAICLFEILMSNKDKLGMDRINILDEGQKKMIIKRLATKYGQNNIEAFSSGINRLRHKYFANYVSGKGQQYTRHGSLDLRNLEINENASVVYSSYEEALFFPATNEYMKEIRKLNFLDFDDLLTETVKLFLHHPDVLKRYQSRWDFIMVDEYQDTNDIQVVLLRLLSGGHNNIQVVGDARQSIYGFRQANIENFTGFDEHFHGATTIELAESFRCQQHILDFADRVLRKGTVAYGSNITAVRGYGKEVKIVENDNQYHEAEGVVEKIKDLIRMQGIAPKDIAILVRKNMQTREFERECVKQRVPYHVLGTAFDQRKEIKDVISILKFIANTKDIVSFERLLEIFGHGLGKKFISDVRELVGVEDENGEKKEKKEEKAIQISLFSTHSQLSSESECILDACKTLSSQQKAGTTKEEAVSSFTAKLEEIVKMADNSSLLELINFVMSEYYSPYLKKVSKGDDEVQERLENIQVLKDLAAIRKGQARLRVEEFLNEIIINENPSDNEFAKEKNEVQLLTIHKSKGLEFKYVFIVGAVQKNIPGEETEQRPVVDYEEERRVFYVAVTRAKDVLFISHYKEHVGETGNAKMRLSQFVTDGIEEK